MTLDLHTYRRLASFRDMILRQEGYQNGIILDWTLIPPYTTSFRFNAPTNFSIHIFVNLIIRYRTHCLLLATFKLLLQIWRTYCWKLRYNLWKAVNYFNFAFTQSKSPSMASLWQLVLPIISTAILTIEYNSFPHVTTTQCLSLQILVNSV